MKIAALFTFKDEADALPAWLKHMEKQVDFFLFRDNESSDGGGAIVQAHPKTVYFDIAFGKYKMSSNDVLLEQAQKYLSNDDWIMIGAPDVFPLFDVRKEVAKADAEGFNCIRTCFPTFFFTKEMHERYCLSKEYEERINNFNIKNYAYYRNVSRSVIALVKNTAYPDSGRVHYRKPRQEPPSIYKPNKKNTNLVFGHYRFRSPLQMQSKLKIRQSINPARDKHKSFKHYPTWNWKDYLLPQKRLYNVTNPMNLTRILFDQLLKGK